MPESFFDRLQHGWNAFTGKDRLLRKEGYDIGNSSSQRVDRPRLRTGTERTIIASVYNRIAMDVSVLEFKHVRLDENGRYLETIEDSLNRCLTTEANIDQTGRQLIQDCVLTLCDEGVCAIVPVDTSLDPSTDGSWKPESLRVGKITQWYPQYVKVSLYNDKTGNREDILCEKSTTAIIENPLYAVMNEPNSTLRRLVRKLAILDDVDEQSGAGKLDVIIQLPYTIRSEQRKQQAEARRKDIEMQLAGSKYGIAYIDGTERVTQLNRAAENNLMTQITYLTNLLYNQLGMSEAIFNGTADERTSLNYHNSTIEPIASAIVNELYRKFLTKTAQSQGQSIKFFRDPFRLVPVDELADISDKLTRNEILSSNEVRGIIGYKPSNDPKADELRNKNISQSKQDQSGYEEAVQKKLNEMDKGQDTTD